MPPSGRKPRQKDADLPMMLPPNVGGVAYLPTAADAEFAGGLLKSMGLNTLMGLALPGIATRDLATSIRERRPAGVYADLVETARRVSRTSPTEIPQIVMDALQAKADRFRSSPAAAGEVLGEYIDPRNAFRQRPAVRSDIFTGPLSRTWNQQKATEFELNELGAYDTPENMVQSWRQTGTYRAPDNKLRQEISDLPATLNLPSGTRKFDTTLGQLLDHPEAYAAYPWLRNVKVKVDRNAGPGGSQNPMTGVIEVSANSPEKIKDILVHEMQHAIQQYEGFTSGGGPMTADIGLHAALEIDRVRGAPTLPNVPRIDEIKTQVADLDRQVRGLGNPDPGLTNITRADRVTPDMFSAAMRGNVGAVWKRDGQEILKSIGKPPNPQKYPVAYSKWAKRAAQQVQRRMGVPENVDAMRDQLKQQILDLEQEASDLIRQTPGYRNAILAEKAFHARRANASGMNNFRKYELLGGEAEARAVQARHLRDAAQLQAGHPLMSYDVPWRETYNFPFNAMFPLAGTPGNPPWLVP